MGFDLKKAISSIAPTLATMLGGPLAGTATTAIVQALGLTPEATQDDITKVVQTGLTPDTIAAIRAADQKHAEVLGQQGIDLEKLNKDHGLAMEQTFAGDRDSARKRETATGDVTTRILAYLIIGSGIAMIAATLAGVTKVDSVLAGTLIGYAVSEMKAVVQYYFGSSSGSARKDERIDSLQSGKTS